LTGHPLIAPVTAFGGVQDIRVGYREREMWGKETRGPFSLHSLPGDHFFLRIYEALLLQIMARYLYPLVREVA
jgi:medium-chain acyl-[acyl-carrier-protein] hydrolase